jgi:hypothetical protein
MLLQAAYEETFGIHTHFGIDESVDPLGLCASNTAEHWVPEENPLKERMRQFLNCNIGTLFNLSFDEFVNRPTYEVEMLISVATEKQAAESAAKLRAEREFKGLS